MNIIADLIEEDEPWGTASVDIDKWGMKIWPRDESLVRPCGESVVGRVEHVVVVRSEPMLAEKVPLNFSLR